MMKRIFNVAGPCNHEDHYMVPMIERHIDVRTLIEQKQYFTIYAPRQTGKTTLVQELVRDYMDGLGEKIGWLVVFDRDVHKTWEEKIGWETVEYKNNVIQVIRC